VNREPLRGKAKLRIMKDEVKATLAAARGGLSLSR
jgi:hypothetical protein